MQEPQRKIIRLAHRLYAEPDRIYSVTIGTSHRRPVFADLSFGHECVDLLRRTASETGAQVYAYCLMPDHVHLLVSATPAYPLDRFIGLWKGRCYATWRRRGSGESFWQRSFYDHALRQQEDVKRSAEYILANPVRAGLCESWREYPLGGSFVFELCETDSQK